jgi:hypothetical protein
VGILFVWGQIGKDILRVDGFERNKECFVGDQQTLKSQNERSNKTRSL